MQELKETKTEKSLRKFVIPFIAIERPVSVAMFFITTLVLGFIAYTRIPLQLLPSGFSPPFLYVTIPTLPSTPADVERDIVIPVEGLLRTIPNVEKVRSRARSDNGGFFVSFRDGTNMDLAYNQLRDRLERARPELPPEAQKSLIWKFNPDDDPLIFLGVRIDAIPELQSTILEQKIVRPLEQLAEVSRVEIRGSSDLRVDVEIDEKRANAAGVSISSIIQSLQDDNFTMAGGTIDTGERKLPIRILAKLDGVDDIKNLPIPNGLHLRDVASVRIAHHHSNRVYHVDGAKGSIIMVFREPSENAVDAAERVRKLIHKIQKEEPRLRVSMLFDQGEVIEDSLGNLMETALWGGFFAILILFVFLRRFHVMLVTASAIPVSMLLTLVVMYLSGTTLNALSLMGLMLSVGMVVDNSIVVTEAIQRRRLIGEKALLAAPRGASEVGLAIIVATSTTIIVFLPMVLMPGSETLSFFLGKIGYPVCIALVASLVVSLIFIPLTLTKMDANIEPVRIRSVEVLQDAYAKTLRWFLTHRQSSILLILLCLFSIAIPFQNMKETDAIEANVNDVRIFFSFETTATFSERLERMEEFEKWLEARKDKFEIHTSTMRLGRWGTPEIRLFLKSLDLREISREEILEKLKENLPRKSGVRWRLGWGSTDQSISVLIEGKDSRKLKSIAENLGKRLEKIDNVFNVVIGANNESALEMHYSVNRGQAEKSGISPLLVGGAIDYALRGRKIGKLNYLGQEAALWVQIAKPGTLSLTNTENLKNLNSLTKIELDDVSIPSPLGGPGLPIGIATDTKVVPGYGEISRTNGQTQTRIQLMTTRDDLASLGKDIDTILTQFNMPKGYRVLKGQRFQDLADERNDRVFALTLAIVFVFLLMGILFESFILPFVIILSIPFAFLGVYWTLYLTGTPFDVMAGVGLIILIGIVVNNAIVLVDKINLNISTKNRVDALVDAGRIRLRPIVMTALTTIGGLIPMAIGGSQIVGIPYAPLGRTVIGGLLASTIFTLFVVPVFYTVFDDLRRFLQRELGT